jgi:hypothetical protein
LIVRRRLRALVAREGAILVMAIAGEELEEEGDYPGTIHTPQGGSERCSSLV